MPQSVANRTRGYYIDHDHRIAAHCNNPNCLHREWLDLPALAGKYGRDTAFDYVRAMLRCSVCKSWDVSVTISACDYDPFPKREDG